MDSTTGGGGYREEKKGFRSPVFFHGEGSRASWSLWCEDCVSNLFLEQMIHFFSFVLGNESTCSSIVARGGTVAPGQH